jgi:hypothetical protein
MRFERCSLNDDKMPNQKQKDGAEGGGGFVVQLPKPRNPRPEQEYRLKQRERIEASPLMSVKFPRLKALRVTLEFFEAGGSSKHGEMKYKLNMEHAKSALCFACPSGQCAYGDFDLSEALAKAVAGRRKVATGELRCQGRRKRGEREPVACGTLLRYQLNLNYD